MRKVNRTVRVSLAIVLLGSTSCATLTGPKRIVASAGIGAGVGAIGGAALSPNDESRALNALVFGLAGALVGGSLGVLSDTRPEPSSQRTDLRARDLGTATSTDKSIREFQVLPNQELPDFLRNRIQPIVIEEYTETDTLGDDGTLHEPHRAYRIKRPGELFARPVITPQKDQEGGSK